MGRVFVGPAVPGSGLGMPCTAWMGGGARGADPAARERLAPALCSFAHVHFPAYSSSALYAFCGARWAHISRRMVAGNENLSPITTTWVACPG